jgi:four helix bundle suffix protein
MSTEQNNTPGFIPPHGGYRKLLTYQKAQIIYDGTVYFTGKYFPKYDRTISQMIQAARSGKQNIAEGSMLSGTSKEAEIKLTNVARSSLEELMLDYEDFLRSRNLPVWDKNHPQVIRLREINKSTPQSNYDTFKFAIEHDIPEFSANAMITLIKITTYLLKNQLNRLESDFIANGGLKEAMTQARLSIRNCTGHADEHRN